MEVPGQEPVSYVYDAASRLTQIVQGTQMVDLEYDALGRRTRLTFPNGIATEYQYDTASHLTALIYRSAAGVVLGDLTYTYDPGGNRLRVGGSFARILLPAPLVSATYDAANRQITFGATSLIYDANGNLLHDGSNSYTWDARNRLVEIVGPSLTASFRYDAFGRRSGRVVNGVNTSFFYKDFTPVQEYSDGTVTANLLVGLGIDEYLTRSDAAGSRSLLTDALGSTLALLDGAGTIQAAYTYEPFGRTVATGVANANTFLYTGRENDGTGLFYYRARYYSPQLQRFINEDPLGLEGGINPYTYADGNPVTRVDPLGFQPFPPPPPKVPGGPWKWAPDPGNSRGGTYVDPKGQSASWESGPRGSHWDVNDGTGVRQRYNRWGTPLTPQQAHSYKGVPQQPIRFGDRGAINPGLAGRLGGIGLGLWIFFHSSPIGCAEGEQCAKLE